MSRLAIVTATTNRDRAWRCIQSWSARADNPTRQIQIVENGGHYAQPYLGTVPAFRLGIDSVLRMTDADVICAFHDDLEILEPGWDRKVLRHFDRVPACGLAGFGGAIGLGDRDLYQKPYAPMQLARIGFRSNLTNAELHGIRSLLTERVACLDGFSQIGRRSFWEGFSRAEAKAAPVLDQLARDLAGEFAGVTGLPAEGQRTTTLPQNRPWTYLEQLGVVHHFYDGMLGCLAARYGWETWYLSVACTHHGGQTAVGDPGYQQWATTKTEGGDHGFWEQAHKIGYETFRDVLPLRVHDQGSER